MALSTLLGCGRVASDLEPEPGPTPEPAPGPTLEPAPAAEVGVVPRCDAGDPLPPELTGSFLVVEVGGRDSAPTSLDSEWDRLAMLAIDDCGATTTGMPDGYTSHGVVRASGDGDGYVYESDSGVLDHTLGFAFTLHVSSERRAGGPVLHLRSVTNPEPWEAWGIRFSLPGNPGPVPPTVLACATAESWTTHRFTGSALGERLQQGGGVISAGDDTPRLELGAPYTNAMGEATISRSLRIIDGRLSLPLSNPGGFEGMITQWGDGQGVARANGGVAPNEADGGGKI